MLLGMGGIRKHIPCRIGKRWGEDKEKRVEKLGFTVHAYMSDLTVIIPSKKSLGRERACRY
jgi:hypothetical protein